MTECVPVLALILTDVQSLGGADPRRAPNTVPFYTIAAASLMTGQTKGNIRQILFRYPELFDPPRYQPTLIRGRQSPRFPRRIISARDLEALRAMFPFPVN